MYQLRVAEIDLKDVESLLNKEPEMLETKAHFMPTGLFLIEFNVYLKNKDWRNALVVANYLLKNNLMIYAEESKFNLCIDVVRIMYKMDSSIDRMNAFKNLMNDYYHNLGEIQ